MSWSYRVVKTVTKIPPGDTDISYGIHEVYYDDNGDVINISESLAHPISDRFIVTGKQIGRAHV